MAAVTETAGTRREWITGNIRTIKVDVTALADTNTWTPGLAIIEYAQFTPTVFAAADSVAFTTTSPANRQGVITAAVIGTDRDGVLVAVGQ